MNFRIKEKLMLWISGIKKNLFQRWRWKIWYFWAKKMMEIYLLITEKFLFWPFREWEIRSLFEPKSWWKDDIYWLLKSSCFELFDDGKYGLFFEWRSWWKRWYLLITEKFLFWTFRWWEIWSFFQPKSWWKDDIYLAFLSFPWYSRTWEIRFFVQCKWQSVSVVTNRCRTLRLIKISAAIF